MDERFSSRRNFHSYWSESISQNDSTKSHLSVIYFPVTLTCSGMPNSFFASQLKGIEQHAYNR